MSVYIVKLSPLILPFRVAVLGSVGSIVESFEPFRLCWLEHRVDRAQPGAGVVWLSSCG